MNPSEQQHGLARNLDASLESVEEILTALLDMSRLDAGAMKAEPSDFRLEDILRPLRIEFGPTAKEKGLDLTFVNSSVSIRSDRRLLRRLLQNLISNAIKYTPKGRVLVGCRRIGRDTVRLEVWDTGLGIPEDKQKSVFREFERLAPAARRAPGLGLGLSIVERLSKVLQHKVSLRSEVGKGSVFSVDLPIVASAPVTHETRETTPHAHLPLSGLIVLAIDNEPRILEGMEALLSGWGCKVVAAASEREAGAVLARLGILPDVIIADYHLDDTNGLTVIASIRDKIDDGLPAILLTADRSPEVRDRAAAADIHVLHKPVKPAALRSLLSKWRMAIGAK